MPNPRGYNTPNRLSDEDYKASQNPLTYTKLGAASINFHTEILAMKIVYPLLMHTMAIGAFGSAIIPHFLT